MKRFLTLSIFVAVSLFCSAAMADVPPPSYWPQEFQSTCEDGGPYTVLPAQGVLWLNELTHTPVSVPFVPGRFGYSGWIWSEGSDLVLSVTGARSDGSGILGWFRPFEYRLAWEPSAGAWIHYTPAGGSVIEVWVVKLDSGCNPVLFHGYLSAEPGSGFGWYSWRQVFGTEDVALPPVNQRRQRHE